MILSGGVRLDPGELGFLLQEEIVGFFLPQACGQAQGTAELTIADRLFAHFFCSRKRVVYLPIIRRR